MPLKNLNPEEIRLEMKKELVSRYAEKGYILNWGKILFPEKFFNPFCYELHNYFIEIMEEGLTSTLAPRNSAKTTIKCFLIPMFLALEGKHCKNQYENILNVQATSSKATNANISLKHEFESNELLHYIYGDLIGEKWTEKQFELKNSVIFSSVGAGESLRGINYKNKRPDYIIIDDLYDDEDINNRTRIEKKQSWVWSSLYPARAKGKPHSIHFQGTAIAKYDILHELAKNKDVVFRKFKAIKDDGTPLYKEVYSLEDLAKDKVLMGTNIFMREMQNEPRDDETSIIKTHWIQYKQQIPDNEKIVERLCGVDPSIGEKETSDATGISVVYKTLDENKVEKYYIIEIYNERISLNERIKLLRSLHERHNFTKVYVEAIAGFKDFCNELKRLTNLPIKEITRVRDKISTMEMKSHYFENSKVFILNSISDKLKSLLVEQLTNNHPQHDDLRDCVLLCLQKNRKFNIRVA